MLYPSSNIVTVHAIVTPTLSWPQLILGIVVIRTLSNFEQLVRVHRLRYPNISDAPLLTSVHVQMGSRKFGNFMFLSWGMSTLGQVGLAATLSSIGLSVVPEPGPFFYIYSLLPFYYSK